MDPLLIDFPERIETERLVLRCPRPGDGPALSAAVCASLDALRPWILWAKDAPSAEESEADCRRMQAKFLLREDLVMLIFEKGSEGPEGPVLGAAGLHRIDWAARCFEIGYWRRIGLDGLGIASEAVTALARLAFDRLQARRVEIRMDDDNERSWKLAERTGFTFEALLRLNAITPLGEPRSTRVYARVRGVEEPESDAPEVRPAGSDESGTRR
ncbi:MAG TPA: GNAT family protein [Caldimonas sp.]